MSHTMYNVYIMLSYAYSINASYNDTLYIIYYIHIIYNNTIYTLYIIILHIIILYIIILYTYYI